MRRASLFLVMLTMTAAMYAQDMEKYLSETEAMIANKNYEEALKRCEWFYAHAAQKDKSMSGVRLTKALDDWKTLADAYPPALKSLTNMRDTAIKYLLIDGGPASLFEDMAAINRTLGQNKATVDFFLFLDKENQIAAKACWMYARDDLFAAGKYDILKKYYGNPVESYDLVLDHYNTIAARYSSMKDGGAHAKPVNEKRLVDETLKYIQYCLAINDMKSAKEIQKKSLKALDNESIRTAIPKEKK